MIPFLQTVLYLPFCSKIPTAESLLDAQQYMHGGGVVYRITDGSGHSQLTGSKFLLSGGQHDSEECKIEDWYSIFPINDHTNAMWGQDA